MEQFFCGQLSRQYNEPLFGTASQFQSLFLLEYSAPWGEKALAESDIPQQVKIHLQLQMDGLTQPRLMLIRQNEKNTDGKITFYAVNNNPAKPFYNEFTLGSYEELLDFNLSETLQYRQNASHEPLYLVCTNGNKDKCCAKFGMTCYKQLLTRIPKHRVWQCTHVGGDRFAPNIVMAPQGAYFARLGTEQMDHFIDQTEQGLIDLTYYRGLCWYGKDVQSAEYYIRRETGLLNFADLEFVEKSLADDFYKVIFRQRATDRVVTVQMIKQISDYEFFLTCQAVNKSKVEKFALIDITGL
ncbi:MAG TPA: sucrase ferredoxin [Alphaproteobacteria bacterium]